jgi:hypothetical protein
LVLEGDIRILMGQVKRTYNYFSLSKYASIDAHNYYNHLHSGQIDGFYEG